MWLMRRGPGRVFATFLMVFLLLVGMAAPSLAVSRAGTQGPGTTRSLNQLTQDEFEACVWDLIWSLGGIFTDAFDGGYALAHATDLASQGRYEEAYGVLVEAAFMIGVPVPFECFPVRQVE
jgi:hypothetical protein